VAIRPTAQEGVFTDGSWLYTRNPIPGRAVYGEELRTEAGVEYRRWDANRSKLAAYLKRGGRTWPFRETSRILYLGAASGTTASHLSDVCVRGSIVAVEISPRSFRDLVAVAEARTNLFPVLGDARRPTKYRAHAAGVDVLYQDVAQRDQETIFLQNMELVRTGGVGFLMHKARSVDVSAEPRTLHEKARAALSSAGLDVLDVRALDPFAADHAAIVARKR